MAKEKRRRIEGAASSNPDIVQALGQLVAEFSILEQQLSFMTWSLIGTDQRAGQIMTAGLPFHTLVDKFCSLIHHKTNDKGQLETLDGLQLRLEKVNEERNRLVHGSWAAGEEPGQITTVRSQAKGKKGLVFTFHQLSANDINAVAEEANSLAADIMSFLMPLPP